jgi:AraC family transcriptional regulator
MICTEFPDLNWLKRQTETRFSARRDWAGNVLQNPGWPNVILNVNTKFTYRDNIKGPLSLFTNLSGESSVEAESKRSIIKPGFFFITNPGQQYTLDINSRTPTETFNIHFGEFFADEVLQSITTRPETVLDGAARLSQRVDFYNRLHFRNDAINKLILFLYRERPTAMHLEEKLTDLITLIMKDHLNVSSSAERIQTIKKSTREEIVRRLIDACDYIYTFYDRDISLDELARVSCLSRFHFLRLFKTAFGKTPHQFINDVRVHRSKELLERTNFDIKTISSTVGFTSSSSFSRMFFQQTGSYPSAYRAASNF